MAGRPPRYVPPTAGSQRTPGVTNVPPPPAAESNKAPGNVNGAPPPAAPSTKTPQAPPPAVPPVPAFTQQTSVPAFTPNTWVPPVPEPTATPDPNGGAPNGYDMSMPGANEMHWDATKDQWTNTPMLDWASQQLPQFQDPWDGEQAISKSMGQPVAMQGGQYWAGVQGSMNTPSGAEQAISGGYKGGNNAELAFKRTQSAMPGSLQPQFDAYYDRMAQKNMSNVNAQSAARGAYGSNTALNGAIGAGLDAEAQRAAAATKFSLDDSANQRSWLDSLSNQGRSADLTGLDIFGKNKEAAQFGLDKTKTMSDIAFGVDDRQLDRDKFGLDQAKTLDDLKHNRLDAGVSTAFGVDQGQVNRLTGGSNASNTAQNSREDRVNNLYNQVSQFSSDTQDFLQENFNQILGGDQAMNDQQLQTLIAQQADQRGWDQQTQERIFRDAKSLGDFINGKKSATEAATGGGTGGATGGGKV